MIPITLAVALLIFLIWLANSITSSTPPPDDLLGG